MGGLVEDLPADYDSSAVLGDAHFFLFFFLLFSRTHTENPLAGSKKPPYIIVSTL